MTTKKGVGGGWLNSKEVGGGGVGGQGNDKLRSLKKLFEHSVNGGGGAK